jgi:ribosomal protein S12 methylthiotransferase accessory factor
MGNSFGASNMWIAAADVLAGADVNSDVDVQAGLGLLDKLGFSPVDAVNSADHNARLAFLRFAGRMSDVFEIAAPDAPGLRFVGGMTRPSLHLRQPLLDRPLSAGGRGRTFADAFMSCIGEAIERTSQYQTEADSLTSCSLDAGLGGLHSQTAEAIREMLEGRQASSDHGLEWVMARIFPTGPECMLPADLCLVRPDDAGRGRESLTLSLGCSAGASPEQALLSGLLEVLERDAATLWWLAVTPARAVSMEALDEGGVLELVRDMRRASMSRKCWFLDITTDLGIPCVVSLSFQAEGGGFAHGVAARPTLGEAAAAAFLEMCQMEVAYHLLALKLASGGEEKLSPADRRHRQRFASVDPDRHPILLPGLGARAPFETPSRIDFLEKTVARLNERGLQCLAVDLTRPEIGVPVFKVFVPGLQPMPSGVPAERLAQATRRSSSLQPMDIPLF